MRSWGLWMLQIVRLNRGFIIPFSPLQPFTWGHGAFLFFLKFTLIAWERVTNHLSGP